MPDAQTLLPLSRGGVMLADGTFFEGVGFGAVGAAVGEAGGRCGSRSSCMTLPSLRGR